MGIQYQEKRDLIASQADSPGTGDLRANFCCLIALALLNLFIYSTVYF